MRRHWKNLQRIYQAKRFARLAKRFARNSSGVTAIEFALVAGPFFFMMMGIVEVTLIFFGNVSLEDALDTVGREIKTGQIQSTTGSPSTMTPAQFKAEVCSKLSGILGDCTNNLLVAVQSFTQFSGAACAQTPDPNDPNPALPFDTGTAGSTVVACAFYKWQITTPVIAQFFANASGNLRILQSTIVFKNEPFTTS